MRVAIRRMILAASVVAMAVTVSGQAKKAVVHAHGVLSVPTQSGRTDSLYYEVCNNSNAPSSFFWQGAGFGVDATHDLHHGRCAFRTVTTPRPYKLEQHRITFQGGARGNVDTWVPDGRPLGNFIATLRIAASPADDMVDMETLTLQLILDPTGNGGRLVARTSDGFAEVLIAFSGSNATVDELKKIFAKHPEIEIQTFSYYRKARQLAPDLLIADIPGESPVISLKKDKDGFIDQALTLGDVARIGQLAAMLAIDKSGKLSARNEVSVPVRPRNQ